MKRGYARGYRQDTSHYDLKRDLRLRFAEKVGADTCFDLFCGSGLMASTVWATRFRKVVCVEKRARQLEDFTDLPNADVFCGDNDQLFVGLVTRYGWPDLFDCDAYGWPDRMVKRILLSRVADKPFAIVATNSGMTAWRHGSRNAVPSVWGFGAGLSFAQFSAGMDVMPVCDYTHLCAWATAGGKQIVEFEATAVRAMGWATWYWAALVASEGV